MLQRLYPDMPLLELQNANRLHGTKNNCMHAQLGQILDQRIQKDKKPNYHFRRVGSNKTLGVRSKSRVLHMPPALSTTNEWESTYATPLAEPWTHPYHHPIKGTSKETCYLSSLYPAPGARAPMKPCLNFLSDLSSISTD